MDVEYLYLFLSTLSGRFFVQHSISLRELSYQGPQNDIILHELIIIRDISLDDLKLSKNIGFTAGATHQYQITRSGL